MIKKWKGDGEKVVFTNGCFDILHLGHIDYLEKASNFGDRLVVGVNSDESVAKLKGKERPINNENSRLRIMAALGFVDAVIKFGEETPLKLIEQLLPDVLVKGKDYKISNIIGADIVLENGGRVETIEFVKGYSTTGLVKRIKGLN